MLLQDGTPQWCVLVYKPHEYYRSITNKNHSYWSLYITYEFVKYLPKTVETNHNFWNPATGWSSKGPNPQRRQVIGIILAFSLPAAAALDIRKWTQMATRCDGDLQICHKKYAIEMSHKSWIYPKKICPDLRTSVDIPQKCYKYEQKSKNVGETWQRWGVNSLRTTIWGCFCWWNMGIQLGSTNMGDSAPPIQHYRYKAVPHTYLSWFIIPFLGVW